MDNYFRKYSQAASHLLRHYRSYTKDLEKSFYWSSMPMADEIQRVLKDIYGKSVSIDTANELRKLIDVHHYLQLRSTAFAKASKTKTIKKLNSLDKCLSELTEIVDSGIGSPEISYIQCQFEGYLQFLIQNDLKKHQNDDALIILEDIDNEVNNWCIATHDKLLRLRGTLRAIKSDVENRERGRSKNFYRDLYVSQLATFQNEFIELRPTKTNKQYPGKFYLLVQFFLKTAGYSLPNDLFDVLNNCLNVWLSVEKIRLENGDSQHME